MQERDLKKLMDILNKAEAEQNIPDSTVHAAASDLSEAQKKKMNALLQDPEKLKKLLDSPIARKMLSDLQGK